MYTGLIMPIEVISSESASKNLRSNRVSRWPDGRASEARLEGAVKVSLQPGFSISKNDSIFTIGSCFAREIEKHLSKFGFKLPALSISIPAEERNSQTGNDLLNKYSVHSMENELRWAFGEPMPADDFFLRAADGLWHDAQLVPNLKPAPQDRVAERRELVSSLFKKLPECRIIVLTLGLAEAWFDNKTKLYLNGMPPQYAINLESNRFELHILSLEDIIDSLDRIHSLLSSHGHPEFKILITVSPVPFKATFSGNDALLANMYSKSVQRSAAELFSRRHENVDYFPSYEIVALSDRKIAYELDNIHVTSDLVSHIMSTVTSAYVDSSENKPDTAKVLTIAKTRTNASTKSTILHKAKEALREREYELAVALYSSLIYRFIDKMDPEEMFNAHLDAGVAMLRAGLPKEGVAELEKAKKLSGSHPRTTYKLALGYARLKMNQEALAMFYEAAQLDPSEPDYHWRLGVQLIRMGNRGDGLLHVKKALELNPNHVGALEAVNSQGA